MIYQPRQGKTFVFEQVVESTFAFYTHDGMMTTRSLCLCRCDSSHPSIVKILRNVVYFEVPPPIFVDHVALKEAMLQDIIEAVRISTEYWKD